jgi:hypothetical protein
LYCASPGWTCPRREAVCANAGVATTAASATAATSDFMIVLRFIEIAPLIARATFETHSRKRAMHNVLNPQMRRRSRKIVIL